MTFWLGAAIGLFTGTFMGVLLTCILVAGRREPVDEALASQSPSQNTGPDSCIREEARAIREIRKINLTHIAALPDGTFGVGGTVEDDGMVFHRTPPPGAWVPKVDRFADPNFRHNPGGAGPA